MAGFTTVQSVGAPSEKDLRDAIERGGLPGARILTSAGQINGASRKGARPAIAQNVKVVFGRDAVAGAHGRNAEEFIYRVRDEGQSAKSAIASAVAAESLGMQQRIGTVAPEFEADLIATAGNPVENITAVRRVVFVMKGGRVYPCR
jgi:imidazolonepropionase-like amidohydrolase